MALMKCEECGGKVSSNASSCPHCGNPVELKAPPKTHPAPPLPTTKAVNVTPAKLGVFAFALVGVLAFSEFMGGPREGSSLNPEKKKAIALEQQMLIARSRTQNEKNVSEFLESRQELLDDARMLAQEDRYSELYAEHSKYRAADDAELNDLLDKARDSLASGSRDHQAQLILQDITELPDVSDQKNMARYEALRYLFPGDEGYADRYAYYEGKVNPPAPTEPKQVNVGAQFSAWDGSHRGLKQHVKSQLSDPGSFEHIETRHHVAGSTISLYMTFRASNAFGGMVVKEILAETPVNGGPISIISGL